jgi:hypothetical protein
MTIEANQRPFPLVTEFGGLEELPGTTFLEQLTMLLRRISAEFIPRVIVYPAVDEAKGGQLRARRTSRRD